jgi:hypothetical protein
MPIIQILSDHLSYEKVTVADRWRISRALAATTARILRIDPKNVASFWAHPYELSSSVNMPSYYFEVACSNWLTDPVLEQLCKALLDRFESYQCIRYGTTFEVCLKTAKTPMWRARTKGR